MPSRIKRLFDLRGELGRIQYLKGFIYRSLLSTSALLAITLFELLFNWHSYQGIESFDVFSTLRDESNLYAVALVALQLPIQIKRIRDLGVSFWWLFAFEVMILLPEPSKLGDGSTHAGGAFYTVLIVIPFILFRLYLILWPGKAFQNRESKRNFWSKGSAKITFSE